MSREPLSQITAQDGRVLVLCYHAVSPTWKSELAVSPEALAWQAENLARRGYRGVTYSEAVLGRHDDKVVAFTFDDGYRSMHSVALPLLSSLGMPATVFVPTDYPGGGAMSWPGIENWATTPDADELTAMTWDEVRELADAGWEIGSHTKSHPRLPSLTEAEIDEELSGSKEKLEEQLGTECLSLAYPYGDYDERVVAAAARAGYRTATTLPSRFVAYSLLSWPRVGIYRDDTEAIFRVKVDPRIRRLRGTRLGGSLFQLARNIRHGGGPA